MILMYLTSQENEKKMPEIGFISEFDGLPLPLEDWGKAARSSKGSKEANG